MIVVYPDGSFGQQLMKLRKQYSISGTALAKLTGINVHLLRFIEEGILRDIDAEFILRLGRIFDIDVEVFCQTELEKD